MAWQDTMIPLLRTMVDDIAETKFDDDQIENALVVGAWQVLREIDFPYDFVADIANTDIDPDPTDEETADDDFINLATTKAACLIDRGAAVTAAAQALRVKDVGSEVDLRNMFSARMELLEKGWCAVYESLKNDYLTIDSGYGLQPDASVGKAILTPFRLYAMERRWW